MVYGNFIKRVLTIAWAFTGLIALSAFPEVVAGLDPGGQAAPPERERDLIGPGHPAVSGRRLARADDRLRDRRRHGAAETFMVGGSALFTRNFYVHAVPRRSDTHYLWVGRLAAGGLLVLGITLAVWAQSVTQLVVGSVKFIGLLGAAFWLGVVWRARQACHSSSSGPVFWGASWSGSP